MYRAEGWAVAISSLFSPSVIPAGPTLRAEVGDTIEVVFLNRLRYPASMHPHGVRYMKDSEGSPYNDGTSGAPPPASWFETGGGKEAHRS
jgi:FtsP/CotA-like multicopper oxidase with cupredoxin domain